MPLVLQLFARGSEGHVYSAMVLDELYSARAQALSKEAARRKSKTLARQKQLTTQVGLEAMFLCQLVSCGRMFLMSLGADLWLSAAAKPAALKP